MRATERLSIAPVGPADGPELRSYALRNQAFLAPWQPLRAAGYHAPAAWRARAEAQARCTQAAEALHYVLRLHGAPEIIGLCTFSNLQRGVFQACNLGYSLDAAQEGRGLMFEALSTLLPHVFAQQKLHRIMANYMPRNLRSGRLLARLGFEEEGLAREYLKIAGRWEDHILTSKINPAD